VEKNVSRQQEKLEENIQGTIAKQIIALKSSYRKFVFAYYQHNFVLLEINKNSDVLNLSFEESTHASNNYGFLFTVTDLADVPDKEWV